MFFTHAEIGRVLIRLVLEFPQNQFVKSLHPISPTYCLGYAYLRPEWKTDKMGNSWEKSSGFPRESVRN